VRLEIDWTRCDGHGLCARLLPERIRLDEHGFPILPEREIGEELLPHARRAVAVCPRLALRLERSVPDRPNPDRSAPNRSAPNRSAPNRPAPSHTVR